MTQNTETHPIVNLLKTVFTLTRSITFIQTEVYKLTQQTTGDQEWCYGTHLVSQNLQVTPQITSYTLQKRVVSVECNL